MSKTRVVNVNQEDFDVYIGRPSKWGNPYTHIKDGSTLAEFVVSSREEAIEKYEIYLLGNKELMSQIDELKGKRLGCWCSPKSCHGDVIAKILEEQSLF